MTSPTSHLSSQTYIEQEDRYGAHNYHPLPVVLSKGEGVYVWDIDGKRYYDFLSAYSAVNQGHCHPRIIASLIEQAGQLTLTSRAFYNDVLGQYEKYITDYFGFEKVLPMNTGAEAVETAIKICRKWGYEKKGVPENEGQIVVFEQNFHGRTTTIISFSSDPGARRHFGPFTPGFIKVPYNDTAALEATFRNHPNIVGVLIEPIQGEAGVFVPDEGYLTQVAGMCRANNALFMADEIQTGIGRTGKLLAIDHENLKADILILGKALSGGAYPVSAVLANNSTMEVITPGTHGSTFGGNPLGARIAMTALQVIKDEQLTENAARLGPIFRGRMEELITKSELITLVRGKGLLNAVVINDTPESSTAWDLCVRFSEKGLLAKPTHGNIIRFAPPLVMNEEQLHECCDLIEDAVLNF